MLYALLFFTRAHVTPRNLMHAYIDISVYQDLFIYLTGCTMFPHFPAPI